MMELILSSSHNYVQYHRSNQSLKMKYRMIEWHRSLPRTSITHFRGMSLSWVFTTCLIWLHVFGTENSMSRVYATGWEFLVTVTQILAVLHSAFIHNIGNMQFFFWLLARHSDGSLFQFTTTSLLSRCVIGVGQLGWKQFFNKERIESSCLKRKSVFE